MVAGLEHPFQAYESRRLQAFKAESQSAEHGAGLLFAYGILLIVCALSTSLSEVRGDTVASSSRACAHGGGLVLFTALSLKGYLPGKKRTLRKKSQAHLARLLLAFVGLGFLWRAYYLHEGRDATEDNVAGTGVMLFLGLLGLVLAGLARISAGTVEAAARGARPTRDKVR